MAFRKGILMKSTLFFEKITWLILKVKLILTASFVFHKLIRLFIRSVISLASAEVNIYLYAEILAFLMYK